MKWLAFFKNRINPSSIRCQSLSGNNDKESSRRGWVFIDALLGITILALGIIAVIIALTHNTKEVSFTNNHTKATYLAQQKLEQLKKYDGGTTVPVLPEEVEISGIFKISYAAATKTLPVNNVTPVQVTVTWTEEGKTNTVDLGAYYYHK
ncbi:MAG: hypothetical protein AB9883_03460 [Acidaminococcaceae bacterium]